MKNEVNRAFMAKKRNYIQPKVLVARIALESMVLTGSPTPTPDAHMDNGGGGDPGASHAPRVMF